MPVYERWLKFRCDSPVSLKIAVRIGSILYACFTITGIKEKDVVVPPGFSPFFFPRWIVVFVPSASTVTGGDRTFSVSDAGTSCFTCAAVCFLVQVAHAIFWSWPICFHSTGLLSTGQNFMTSLSSVVNIQGFLQHSHLNILKGFSPPFA